MSGVKKIIKATSCVVYKQDKNGKQRLKWAVGKTYSVQPGRGKKGTHRIKIIAIRAQYLDEMKYNDAYAEGFANLSQFREAWDKLNKHDKIASNPYAWVLEFELVEKE